MDGHHVEHREVECFDLTLWAFAGARIAAQEKSDNIPSQLARSTSFRYMKSPFVLMRKHVG
jgi:hypothetical protein